MALDNINQEIVVGVTGADQASAALDSVKEGMGGIVEAHNEMKSRFSERFQHIGLMLFAGEMLRANGLGSEGRIIIGTLSMGITSLANAFGLAGGPLMLFVTGLAAAVGIAEKLSNRHAENVENLKKLHDATEKSIKDLDDEIVGIETYIQYSGKATEADQTYLDQLRKVRQEQIDLQIKTDEAEIKGLEAVIQIQQKHVNEVSLERGVVLDMLQSNITMLQLTALAWEKFTGESARSAREQKQHIEDTNREMDKNRLQIDKLVMELEKLREGSTKSFKEMGDDAKKTFDAWSKEMDKTWDESVKDEQAAMKKMAANVKSVTGQISGSFGGAFAKMLMEGESFTKNMEQAFTKMVEKMIEQIIQLIAEWSIFSAMAGLGGPMGGIGAAGLKSLGVTSMFAGASGGDMLVSKPTMFLAGEAGPERVTVSPMSGGRGGGGGGGGGGSVININVVNNGVNDPQKIGRQIIEAIRGQGQLSFLRGN